MGSCPSGQEYDAGLCYTDCPPNFTGEGETCFENCPAGYEVHDIFCVNQVHT